MLKFKWDILDDFQTLCDRHKLFHQILAVIFCQVIQLEKRKKSIKTQNRIIFCFFCVFLGPMISCDEKLMITFSVGTENRQSM